MSSERGDEIIGATELHMQKASSVLFANTLTRSYVDVLKWIQDNCMYSNDSSVFQDS